jgi:hypothetical protein
MCTAVIAGLVPAIPMPVARSCFMNRDHRDSPLRGGPVMTEIPSGAKT